MLRPSLFLGENLTPGFSHLFKRTVFALNEAELFFFERRRASSLELVKNVLEDVVAQ